MASSTSNTKDYDNHDEVVNYFISYINSYQQDDIDTESLEQFIKNPDIDLESYCYFYFNKISIYVFHKILLEVIEKCLYVNSNAFTFGKVFGIMIRYIINYHDSLIIKNANQSDIEIINKLKKHMKYAINQIITKDYVDIYYNFSWNIQLQLSIYEPFHKKIYDFYSISKDTLLLENIKIINNNTIVCEEDFFGFSEEFVSYTKIVINKIFHF